MSNEDNHLSDKVIVTGILNGNIQGFAVLVSRTEKLVTQIVTKMTPHEEDQKDLVQDIYLKAYQNLYSFQFKSKLSTWIASIAYHTSINFLQKKRIPIIGDETDLEGSITVSEDPYVASMAKEAIEVLNTAIAQLPPLYKTLITLYHLEELPNKDIAEITGLPEGTIKSYLYRARKILKDKINHHHKNDPL